MKKIFIIIPLFVVLVASNLNAKCYYADCTSYTTSLVEQTQQEMQKEFNSISQELSTLEQNYEKQSKTLEENNKLYEKNRLLKEEYLILLKQINHEQNILKNNPHNR